MKTQPGSLEGDRLVTDRIVWVAFEGRFPVGLIDVETYEDSTASFALVVAPHRRGLGIGRGVIHATIQHPRLDAVSTWVVGVEPTNPPSIRCLEGAGFKLRSATPDHQGLLIYEWRSFA
jgi:RimJ/RimL family protein N-acetyltransferase